MTLSDLESLSKIFDMTRSVARSLCDSWASSLFTSDKRGGKRFCPRLSVCLLARLLKTRAWIWMKCCVSTDVETWTNWLTFEPEPDCFLRYRLSAATRNFTSENPTYTYWPLQRGVVLTWLYSLRQWAVQTPLLGGTCDPPSIGRWNWGVKKHVKIIRARCCRSSEPDASETCLYRRTRRRRCCCSPRWDWHQPTETAESRQLPFTATAKMQ